MSRIGRCLVNGLTVLSLLAAGTVAWLWWRGGRLPAGHEDVVTFVWNGTRRAVQLKDGRIALLAPPPVNALTRRYVREYLFEFSDAQIRWRLQFDGANPAYCHFPLEKGVRWDSGDPRGAMLDVLDDPEHWVRAHLALSLHRQGIVFRNPAQLYARDDTYEMNYDGVRVRLVDRSGHFARMMAPTSGLSATQFFPEGELAFTLGGQQAGIRDLWFNRCGVPVASVAIAWVLAGFAAAPLGWLARRVVRARTGRHRRRAGLCPACGYDLRVTPERCPECGAARGAGDRDA
jgi:hypothetical protein